MTLGRAKEDQLEAILILGKRYYTVRCIDVARFLSITNATVSATIKDLVKNGFVVKSPDNALSLTEKGRELAMQVYEKPNAMRRRLSAALILCLALLVGCAQKTPSQAPLSGRIANADQVIAEIRQGLKDHARTITIRFSYGSDIFDELNGVIDDWVEEALKETEDPAEGDYIRYQYGGYTWTSRYGEAGERLVYTVTITPVYYCYLIQEEQAGEEIARRLKAYGFQRRTTDLEKIAVIYDDICQTVNYDKVHRKNPYSHLKSTAYAAMVLHSATCQGYCTAAYRLLREAGIGCRVVTGTADGESGEDLHAWLIVELDGLWYALDPTWDAGCEEYQYFLVGEEELSDRIWGDRFRTEEFRAAYPLSKTAYTFPE